MQPISAVASKSVATLPTMPRDRSRPVKANDNGAEKVEVEERKLHQRRSSTWRVRVASLVTLTFLSILIAPRLFSPPAQKETKSSPARVGKPEIRLTSMQELQIQNYKEGRGLILNFHITHHGGTTTCFWARENGPVPDFVCMSGENVPAHLNKFSGVDEVPWSLNQTDFYVRELRKHFHFVAWEFNWQTLPSSLNDTNFEHPNLLSIIILRNPMTRLMSSVGRYFVKNDTAEEWWDYASNSLQTDNYALRSLTSYEGCCQGDKTTSEYVEMAKTYLKRFTFIIDLECLKESLIRLSDILNLNMTKTTHRNQHTKSKRGRYPVRSRLKNDTLYMHLVKRNARDIELYRWAKKQALVRCRHNAPIVDLKNLSMDL